MLPDPVDKLASLVAEIAAIEIATQKKDEPRPSAEGMPKLVNFS
jgi:hypothetical protein